LSGVICRTLAQDSIPVSTTHTISSAVLGCAATTKFSAVRWGIAGNILVAWLLTLPAADLVGAGVEELTASRAGSRSQHCWRPRWV
jgi:phosphate/sulfate permease